LAYSPPIVAASAKILEEAASPDVQVTFVPGNFKGGQIGELEDAPGLSAGAWQMRPLMSGAALTTGLESTTTAEARHGA
jgi:choline dehydrogenase